MGLLEDVVINAKSAGDMVGKKAGQIRDMAKLKISAADLENDINKRFEALGRAVYDAKKSEDDSNNEVQECIALIDELYEQLDAINEQLLALSKKTVCKACSAENPLDAAYCNKCGQKIADE